MYIAKKDNIDELHAVWDSVIYESEDYPELPLSDSDWKKLGDRASVLVKEHKVDWHVWDLNPHHWGHESFE